MSETPHVPQSTHSFISVRASLSCPTSHLDFALTTCVIRGRNGLGGGVQSFVTGAAAPSFLGHSPLHMQNMSCCPLTPAQFAAVTHFFFISFSLTVTFMFICSVQLRGIWRGCFPLFFFPPPLPLSLFSLLTKILMQICMPQ